ncbi:MAG TPA: hypothetical protein VGF21_00765 [Thermoleophilaceae bacterium]
MIPAAVLIAAAAASTGLWWRRHRRADALLKELGRGLALAAEAEGVWWRLERRYTDDLSELARVRRELAPLLVRRNSRWELCTSDDGSSFELAILALPVRGPHRLRRRGRALGYQRLLTARGHHGVIAYDSFAENERYLPGQPQRASAVA